MSEPLRPTDPSRIAGFRLLRRLGRAAWAWCTWGVTTTAPSPPSR